MNYNKSVKKNNNNWQKGLMKKYTLFLGDIFRKEEMISLKYYITSKELVKIFDKVFGDYCIY